MTSRLFIGISFADAIDQTELARVGKTLDPVMQATWVEAAKIHLTLKFLGDTPDEQIAEIKAAVAEFAPQPFRVSGASLPRPEHEGGYSVDDDALTRFVKRRHGGEESDVERPNYGPYRFDTEIVIERLGLLPRSGPPHILYSELCDEDGLISSLAEDTEEAMVKLGFPPEKRRFTPHLTLARIKSADRRRLIDAIRDLGEMEIGRSRAIAVRVIESRLTSAGARYVII